MRKRGYFFRMTTLSVLPSFQIKDKFHQNCPYKIQFLSFHVLNSLVKHIVDLDHERYL